MKETKSFKLNLKDGFTIAEMLLVVAIIGIFATLTIPPLVADVQKQITTTKVKEAYSLLSKITADLNQQCGNYITDCLANPNSGDNDSVSRKEIIDLYKAKIIPMKDCTDGTTKGCFANLTYKNLDNSDNYNFETAPWVENTQITAKNGISIEFDWNGADYYPNLFSIYIDTNGPKPPNQYGKDTFWFYYNTYAKVLKPYTTDPEDCKTTDKGFSCAAKIIRESAINYY